MEPRSAGEGKRKVASWALRAVAALALSGSSLCWADAPKVLTAPAFLASPAHGWARREIVFGSVASDYADLTVAIECEPKAKRVFFDSVLLSMLIKSSANPNSSLPALTVKPSSDPVDVVPSDWQAWTGEVALRVDTPTGSRTDNFRYFTPSMLNPAGKVVEIPGYGIKINGGDLRPAEVQIYRGAKADIASALLNEIRKALGVPLGQPFRSVEFSMSAISGRTIRHGFDLTGLEKALDGALDSSCN